MDALSIARAACEAGVGERAALIVGGATLTFGDLAGRASGFAAALADLGVAEGDRVAIRANNGEPAVLAILAAIELGAAVVPIHPRLTETEVKVVTDDAEPRVMLDGRGLAAFARRHRGSAPTGRLIDPERPLAIVYTSGTTGKPKGAVLSRRAFLASAAASAENLGFFEHDRWLCCMPICHVGGLSILTRCLLARRAVILEPRFDPEAVLASVALHRATLLSVVPTMLAALLERDRAGALARLRAILVGGAAAPLSLLEECARRGVRALATYGLTEACSQVTVQRLAPREHAEPGSGAPLPGVEARIVEGSVIAVRGPTLMSGYFRGPGAPLDAAVDEEGFFRTGDLGSFDEAGNLHVLGRRTDLVVTGGENVYPLEIEQRLEAEPGVRRALVFGVPDARWGEVVAAALELEAGVSLAEVVARASADLAPHKRPRLAGVATALAVTGPGKLVRAKASERYASILGPVAVSPRGLGGSRPGSGRA